jgi:SAM-dependent methyltransferase
VVVNICGVGHVKHDRLLVDTALGKMWIYDDTKYSDHAGFYCTGQDAISGALRMQGSWEDRDTIPIRQILEKGNRYNIVVDFGCHIGWYTIMAAQLGYNVIAIDGDAENLELLRLTAKLHGVEDKITTIHDWVDADFSLTLPYKPIELVKVDLEGNDAMAVNSIDLNSVNNLYVEISPAFNDGYPELVDKITDYGFKAFYPEGQPFDNDFSESQINLRFSK